MSLRDRLRGRQLPQATVGIRLDWSPESYELHERLEKLERAVLLANASDEGDLESLQNTRDELRAKVDGLYEFLTIKALPASEMEQLINEHPPTAEQARKEPNLSFNRDTFYPALLAACVEGTDTADDWAAMISSGELVIGEVNTLISTAMDLNDRSPSVSLGKGSTTTSS